MSAFDTDRVVVARGFNTKAYHRPDPDADEAEPDCRVRQQPDTNWGYRDADGIDVWKDPCRYCTGDVDFYRGGTVPAEGES